MPRKKKGEGMRYKTKMITAPGSFFTESGLNPTEVFQDAVASRVTGISLEDYSHAYGKGAHAFRPETPKQAWIRAARWILESEILEARDAGGAGIYLLVRWPLSGATTGLLVGPPATMPYLPKHVIYDTETGPMERLPSIPTGLDLVTKFCCMVHGSISPARVLLLHSWLSRSELWNSDYPFHESFQDALMFSREENPWVEVYLKEQELVREAKENLNPGLTYQD